MGSATTGLTLVTADGTSICETVTVLQYGVITCRTKAMTIDSVSLRVKYGADFYSCEGTSGECDFLTDSTFPTVSTITKQDEHTLIFEGSGLQLLQNDFTAYATFNGIKSDTVTLDSDIQATATFVQGIPIGSAVKARLYFKNADLIHWADSTATVTNALATGLAIDSDIECSFQGGCLLKVNQPGLVNNLLNDTSKNVIRVCGQVCSASATTNTESDSVSCVLPALATTKSILDFTIIGESYLYGTPFSSKSALTLSVWDGSH